MKGEIHQAGNLLPLTVTEGVMVNVLPNAQHEFLLSTKEAAHGYGTSAYAVRKAFFRHPDEFIEGKHFLKGGTKCPTPANAQPHQVFWTKRGIVRLGFFIKSERAKLFRDWAEDLILCLDAQRDLFEEVVPTVKPLALPSKRKHNRLTSERLLSIMSDVCRIEDAELRIRISEKLKGGAAW